MSDTAESPNLDDKENAFIAEHLDYIDDIFKQLHLREQNSKLPKQSRRRLNDFKCSWQKFFSNDAQHDEAQANAAVNTKPAENQGAIPKRKPTPISDSNSVSPCQGGTSSDSSSSGEIILSKRIQPRAREQKRTKPCKIPKPSALDLRTAAPMKKFDSSTGQSLLKYLERFEDYCRRKFVGDSDTWVDELERHLIGRSLEIFNAAYSPDESYEVIKRRLLEWDADMRDAHREDSKTDFRKAERRNGETMHMYANRLGSLYKRAYPNRNLNFSRTLREKYVSSVPRSFGAILEGNIMSRSVKGKPIPWKLIETYARHYDISKTRKNRKPNEDSDDDIVNSATVKRKTKDASTQFSVESSPTGSQNYQRARVVNRGENREQKPWFTNFNNVPRKAGACYFCGRLGHREAECRAKQKLCFLCGAGDHFVRQCPNAVHHQREPRSSSQPAPRRNLIVNSNDRGFNQEEFSDHAGNNQRRTSSCHDQTRLNRRTPAQRL